jgi:hypothetical protein
MPRIFVSYRREDNNADAGRIADRMRLEFGNDAVFIDVEGIRLGVDFVKRLTEEVARSDVVLVVIGRNWIDFADETGARRLDSPRDFVRIEIRAALQRHIRVIPILIDGAKVPRPDQLPRDIAPLAVRNGLDVRHSSFHRDLDLLVRELKPTEPDPLPKAASPRLTMTPIERGANSALSKVSLWVLGSTLSFLVTIFCLAVATVHFKGNEGTIVLSIAIPATIAAVMWWSRSEQRRELALTVGILAMSLSCSISSIGPNSNFGENLLWLHPTLTVLLIAVFTFARRWRLKGHLA